MGLRDGLAAGLAKQLGKPSGVRGRAVGAILNRRNGPMMTAAVDAADARGGETAADIGFGGGLGLAMLLDRVHARGDGGTVHGVDISPTMIAQAERRFARARTAGRLRLHLGSLTDLPLADGSIDAAVTTNTIYFVDDLAMACNEIARVLSPAGRAVIGIGDPAAMGKEPFTQHGFRLRSVAEIETALGTAGMTATRTRVGTHDAAAHLLLARHA